jgi:hypothetical protein
MMNLIWRARCVVLIMMAASNAVFGQSTFGTILGTVHDTSGAVMPGCAVTAENVGTSAKRSTLTDEQGSYTVQNLEPGTYTIKIELPGFQITEFTSIVLTARQTIRLDGTMKVATQAETVSVTAEAAPVINTEVSNIAETKTSLELIELPAAVTARSTGSTSALTTLTMQPGVQTDASGNISVVGGKPAMLSTSIDGISSMAPRSSAPMSELFPSNDSIAEIRVSEVNNSAEFSGVSDITTISKSGNNSYHGSLSEGHINTVLTAANPITHSRPKTLMNDFGFSIGGPVAFPHLYSGKDKTFFFLAAEGLRLPKEQALLESVPSLALRSGDLSSYSTQIKDPNGGIFVNNQIPGDRIQPISKNVMNYFFPLPNTGAANAIANNYATNFRTPITSNQGDVRIDRNINSAQSTFVHMTWKQRSVITAPTTSVLIGPFSQPETDYGLTAAHNWVIGPTLLNEVRGGFTERHTATKFGLSTQQVASELGLVNLPEPGFPYPRANVVPNFSIAGFQATGGSQTSFGRQGTIQILDNMTWNSGGHSLKLGGDYRYLTGYSSDVFASTQLGTYTFNNSITSSIVGNAFASFLLGIPDKTQLATVIQPDSDGVAYSLAFYVQDDWKFTPKLTLNYGLRWEYHPMFWDRLLNGTNFDPNYVSVVNGKRVNGAVILQNQNAFKILNPDFAKSIGNIPIITAAQDGIPDSMRFSQKTDFLPRFGFAYRPDGTGKTVIRGGYGLFVLATGGALIGADWGIHTSNYALYTQTINNGRPTLQFPYPFPANLAQPGTQNFQQAQDIHFQDQKVHQWNFTIERDLGHGTGVRLSYNGSHGFNLGRQGNLDQLPPNASGYVQNGPLQRFPDFAYMAIETNGGYSNFNGVTAAVTKRLSSGLQFQSSYALTRNLTNAQGYNPTGFASEAGGIVTDLRNTRIDYGNVAFSRKHRFLSTFLYQLPGPKTGILSQMVGGWEMGGVLLFQSGPFMTITVPGADPMGNGFPNLIGNGKADSVPGVPLLYPGTKTPAHWIHPAAFAVPPSLVGRYPTAPTGNVVGPGTEVFSMSLMKSMRIREGTRFQVGAQAANVFNHQNWAAPNTTFNTASFGTISNVQTAENAGPRQIQITGRLTF